MKTGKRTCGETQQKYSDTLSLKVHGRCCKTLMTDVEVFKGGVSQSRGLVDEFEYGKILTRVEISQRVFFAD
jgi:hypothetical protein